MFRFSMHDRDDIGDRIAYLETVVFNKASSVPVDYNELSSFDKGINNHIEIATILIQNHADVNAIDKRKETPLHKVVINAVCTKAKSIDMITLLLSSGANAWIKNYDTQTAASLMFTMKLDFRFWLTAIGNDTEANFLVAVKSPILYVNQIFKSKEEEKEGGRRQMSYFAKYIHDLLVRQDVSILKSLLLWNIALVRAAAFHPSESADLLAFATLVENAVHELFNSDSLDTPRNVQKLLHPDKCVCADVNLLKYQINAFRQNGLLDLCIAHQCKFIFEKQQVFAFIKDIFWYSATVETGRFERDLLKKTTTSVLPEELQHHSVLGSIDLAFRLFNINPMDSEVVRLSYGPRACPALRFISEAFSKILMVMVVAWVSVFQYGPVCGTVYTGYCADHFSWSELSLVIMYISTVFYELGELAEVSWCLKEYFGDEWNYLDVGGLVCVLLWLLFRASLSLARVFLALSAIPLSLGLLRYVAASRSMGVMVTIAQAMLLDLLGFLLVYLLCVLGFGIFFMSLFFSSGSFDSVGNTTLEMFQFSLNSFDFSVFDSDSPVINGVGQVVLAVYLVFTAILLVNLLIARMSNAYQRIDDKAVQEWSFNTSKTVQKNLLLTEKHPFSMLMPPFNLLALPLAWTHFKYLDKGLSVAGTMTNALLQQTMGGVRTVMFIRAALPALRGVAYTAVVERHRNVFVRLVYIITNTLVLILFVLAMCVNIAFPFVFDWYYRPLPKPRDWVERVEQRVPESLFLQPDLLRFVGGAVGSTLSADAPERPSMMSAPDSAMAMELEMQALQTNPMMQTAFAELRPSEPSPPPSRTVSSATSSSSGTMFPETVDIDKISAHQSQYKEQLTYGRTAAMSAQLFTKTDIARVMALLAEPGEWEGQGLEGERKRVDEQSPARARDEELQELRQEVQGLKASVQTELAALRQDMAQMLELLRRR